MTVAKKLQQAARSVKSTSKKVARKIDKDVVKPINKSVVRPIAKTVDKTIVKPVADLFDSEEKGKSKKSRAQTKSHPSRGKTTKK